MGPSDDMTLAKLYLSQDVLLRYSCGSCPPHILIESFPSHRLELQHTTQIHISGALALLSEYVSQALTVILTATSARRVPRLSATASSLSSTAQQQQRDPCQSRPSSAPGVRTSGSSQTDSGMRERERGRTLHRVERGGGRRAGRCASPLSSVSSACAALVGWQPAL